MKTHKPSEMQTGLIEPEKGLGKQPCVAFRTTKIFSTFCAEHSTSHSFPLLGSVPCVAHQGASSFGLLMVFVFRVWWAEDEAASHTVVLGP
jgi:hypothetical protein